MKTPLKFILIIFFFDWPFSGIDSSFEFILLYSATNTLKSFSQHGTCIVDYTSGWKYFSVREQKRVISTI